MKNKNRKKSINVIISNVLIALVLFFCFLLFIGMTRIDVAIYNYYQYISYKFGLDLNTVPQGASQAGRDFYGEMQFIYKGALPKPNETGNLYMKNDCDPTTNKQNIPHHFVVCLPERGIYQISPFVDMKVRSLGKGVYYVTGGVDDYY